jgi:hypothetical protein
MKSRYNVGEVLNARDKLLIVLGRTCSDETEVLIGVPC